MVSGGAAGSGSGFQATLRPGQIQQAQAAAQTQQVPQSVEPPGATLRPGAIAAMVAGGAGQPGAAGAANTIRPGAGTILPGAIGGRVLTPNKLSRDELRLHQRRLQYFCTRLIRERGAYCPLNGMLQVIPLKWSESTAYEPLLESVKQDLQMMHDSLHLQFPVVVLQSGLEELTGLPAFLERIQEMNPRLRDSRAGSSYPAGLVIDQNSTSWNVEKGLAWFRDWIYDAFAKSLGSPLNRPMYQLLCALFDRRARIARELQLTAGDLTVSKPIRLAGCYFAATGIDKSQQAFVNDVLQRLMQVQNEVAWMPDWRSHDRKLLWLAAIVALLTLVVVAGDGYLVWKIWQQVAQAAE